MGIKYTEFWTWNKKILITVDFFHDYKYVDEIKSLNKNNDYHFYFLDRNQYKPLLHHDFLSRVRFSVLNKQYLWWWPIVLYYNALQDFITEHGIKHILFFWWGQYRHPKFLQQLQKKSIVISLFTVDDDTSMIKYYSLPYTRYYDYHFHVWVMYDDHMTMAEKFKEYGSKNPLWVPMWALATHINHTVDFENRNIDVCYIGNINPPKFFRISKLKKHFGDRLKLYWAQWNGDWKSLKWIFYKICNKIFGFWYIEKLTDEKIKEIYATTKIGFNLHLVPYKWPSNWRMYELPINWTMQVADNGVWTTRIFELWKEIVCYKNIRDAIQKIEYYLQHDKERIEIAKQWYKRALHENYTWEHSLHFILNKIFSL